MWRIRKKWWILLAFMSFTACGLVQDARGRAEPGPLEKSGQPHISPGQVVEQLRKQKTPVAKVWNKLGIADDTSRLFARGERPIVSGRWEASLRQGGSAVTAVMLTDDKRNGWRDLVFMWTPDERWRFAGVWDMPGRQHGRPKHAVIAGADGMSGLAIRYDADRPESCGSEEEEVWLLPKDGRLTEAFRFPSRAEGCGSVMPSYRTDYSVDDYRQWTIGGQTRMELRYNVSYSPIESGKLADADVIWSQTAYVRYRWDSEERRYVHDPANSEALDTFAAEGRVVVDPDKLVGLQGDSLLRLARNGGDRERLWLSELLAASSRKGPAAAALESALLREPSSK